LQAASPMGNITKDRERREEAKTVTPYLLPSSKVP